MRAAALSAQRTSTTTTPTTFYHHHHPHSYAKYVFEHSMLTVLSSLWPRYACIEHIKSSTKSVHPYYCEKKNRTSKTAPKLVDRNLRCTNLSMNGEQKHDCNYYWQWKYKNNSKILKLDSPLYSLLYGTWVHKQYIIYCKQYTKLKIYISTNNLC